MNAEARDVLGLLMVAFDGLEPPPATLRRLREAPAAGITLFRYLNVDSAGQVRALTDAVQAAAASGGHQDDGPLLVAADQEGGQLSALGDLVTAFPGNMALGAAGSSSLAERVGRATGTELRALGVNVAYAPVCDLATNPANPGIGIRSFGSDPGAAGALAAAMVRGLRSAGVAATAKHFPGLGDVASDSHLGLPEVGHDRERLERIELVPFRAAIDAGADVVMSAHVALPAVDGSPSVPATLSRAVMTGLLREALGFEGVAITDALDMAALPQDEGLVEAVVAALTAGNDLLLCAPDEAARLRIEAGLTAAAGAGRVDAAAVAASRRRLARLRGWLRSRAAETPPPNPSTVRSREHAALAAEVAARAVTLVRNEDGLLPIRDAGARIAVVTPRPEDLTPADTSATVTADLAGAIRGRFPAVTDLPTTVRPADAEIAALREAAQAHDVVVVGTISASLHAEQVRLIEALLGTGRPVVTVALRTPFDLAAYPRAPTHACTYDLHQVSLEALAAALAGEAPFTGRLPVAIDGVAPLGHGLAAKA